MKHIIAIAAMGCALAGCATRYGGAGLTGGHVDQTGPGKLQKVDFHGNGFIASDTVQKYALYRCAELAKQKGKPHFVIYDSLLAAANERPAQLPRVGSLGNKPSASAFMLMLDQPRNGSLQTQAVLDELDALVKATPTAK